MFFRVQSILLSKNLCDSTFKVPKTKVHPNAVLISKIMLPLKVGWKSKMNVFKDAIRQPPDCIFSR